MEYREKVEDRIKTKSIFFMVVEDMLQNEFYLREVERVNWYKLFGDSGKNEVAEHVGIYCERITSNIDRNEV